MVGWSTRVRPAEVPAPMTVPVTRLPQAIEQTDDRQTLAMQATQRRTQLAVNQRGAPPNILGPFTFTIGQVQAIQHKLARQPTEWAVIDVTGGYGLFQRTAWDVNTISIQSSNACTIMLRVA